MQPGGNGVKIIKEVEIFHDQNAASDNLLSQSSGIMYLRPSQDSNRLHQMSREAQDTILGEQKFPNDLSSVKEQVASQRTKPKSKQTSSDKKMAMVNKQQLNFQIKKLSKKT